MRSFIPRPSPFEYTPLWSLPEICSYFVFRVNTGLYFQQICQRYILATCLSVVVIFLFWWYLPMLCNGSNGQKLSRAPGMHLNGRDLSGGHQRGATLPPEQRGARLQLFLCSSPGYLAHISRLSCCSKRSMTTLDCEVFLQHIHSSHKCHPMMENIEQRHLQNVER